MSVADIKYFICTCLGHKWGPPTVRVVSGDSPFYLLTFKCRRCPVETERLGTPANFHGSVIVEYSQPSRWRD